MFLNMAENTSATEEPQNIAENTIATEGPHRIENQNITIPNTTTQHSSSRQQKRPRPTRVANIRKKSLNHMGYKDLEHWLTDANHVYIGRNMTHYVPGAVGSKWHNPFRAKQHGHKSIDMYRQYIETDQTQYDGKTLLESIEELRGKTLGCWCHPDPCHGDVLVQILMRKSKESGLK